jgi:hypothetical protein
MGTPSREVADGLGLLADAIRGLHDVDLAKVGESIGKAHGLAYVASEKVKEHEGTIKELRKEIQSLRVRVKLFDACIEEYHETVTYYANPEHWTMVLDPGQPEATHAIKHGWGRAGSALEKATRYSDAIAKHLEQGAKYKRENSPSPELKPGGPELESPVR